MFFIADSDKVGASSCAAAAQQLPQSRGRAPRPAAHEGGGAHCRNGTPSSLPAVHHAFARTQLASLTAVLLRPPHEHCCGTDTGALRCPACPQEKEDWINAVGRAIVKHSRSLLEHEQDQPDYTHTS